MHKRLLAPLILIILVIVLGACTDNVPETSPTPTQSPTLAPSPSPTPIPTPEPTPTPVPTPTTVDITIGAVGDIMCHERQLIDAYQEDIGTYVFNTWFEEITPALSYPDLMIGNLETTLGGPDAGYAGYPHFSTPDSILPALKKAGFDVLTTANNHCLDTMQPGLLRTREKILEAGFYQTGTFSSQEQRNTPLIIDVKGVKVAVIAATYSANAREKRLSEEEYAYMAAWLDTDSVIADIKRAKSEGADIICVNPHWGYEYHTSPNSNQKKQAKAFIAAGAHVIFGHHPHVLQPVESLTVELEDGTTREGLVFWSLGNFISNQRTKPRDSSAVVYATFRYDRAAKEVTRISSSYIPTWVYSGWGEDGKKHFHVIPCGPDLDHEALFHEVNWSKGFLSTVNRVWRETTEFLGEDISAPISGWPEDEIVTDVYKAWE